MEKCPDCGFSTQIRRRLHDGIAERCLDNRDGSCPPCQKLVDIDRKIDEARRVLKSLNEEREGLAFALNEHHDPFIRRLPVEIVSRVFEHYLPVAPETHASDGSYNDIEIIKSVFTLCHICSNWRSIAQNTPQLWTIVCITKSDFTPEVGMLDQWLRRSGQLPLYMQLRVGWMDEEFITLFSRECVASVVRHAQRWDVLDLSIPSVFLTALSAALSGKHLAQLNQLNLRIQFNFEESDAEILELMAAPRQLILKNTYFSQISANLTKLTHVYVRQIRRKDLMQIFQSAPLITYCDMIDLKDNDTPDGSMPLIPVVALSLRTIIIDSAPLEFWDDYSFPSLETLSVTRCCIGFPARCLIGLQAHLRRSGCKVRVLTLAPHQLHSQCRRQVINILKLTPDLERLSVQSPILNDSFFSEMEAAARITTGAPHSTPEFLNNLKSMSCQSPNLAFNWSHLMGFLQTMISRSQSSLQSFEIRYYQEQDIEKMLDRDTFKRLMDVVYGLEFRLLDHMGQDVVEKLRNLYQ